MPGPIDLLYTNIGGVIGAGLTHMLLICVTGERHDH
jgi:hypothetical protein